MIERMFRKSIRISGVDDQTFEEVISKGLLVLPCLCDLGRMFRGTDLRCCNRLEIGCIQDCCPLCLHLMSDTQKQDENWRNTECSLGVDSPHAIL